MSKLKSRKLWLTIASLLGSIAAAIAGFATDNQMVILVGVICGVVSTSIYTIAESMIDCERTEEEQPVQDDLPVLREILQYTYGSNGTVTVEYTDGTTETFKKDG